jgi:hypothetical protein
MQAAVALLVGLLVLVMPPAASAQARLTGADILGTVKDESGAALTGVSVISTSLETGVVRKAVTDTRGQYWIGALPPGHYRIAAQLTGFRPQVHDDVALFLGQQAEVDFTLRVAAGGEDVTVVSEAPALEVGKTAVASVLGRPQIDNLPINGRDFLSFALLTPGVVTDRSPFQGVFAGSGLSFVGQRARSNNIMVDGFDNNDVVWSAVAASYSQEAVQEFQVLASAYSAELGSASGGVVNIVTKRGTNAFHGNAFLYFRDESLNSRDHFEKLDVFGDPVDVPKAPFGQKQWGATLSGPIRKERTFFFLSLERLDVQANNFVTIDPGAATVLRGLGFPVELGAVPYEVATTQLLAKLDHQWSPTQSLTLRGQFSDRANGSYEPFGGLVARSAGGALERKDWTVSASETDVLASSWVNEARLQLARGNEAIRSLDPSCGGACDDAFQGGPTLLVRGVATVGRNLGLPEVRKVNRAEVADTLSRSLGSHLVKAGADFIHYFNTERHVPTDFGGRFQFAALPAIPGLVPRPLSALEALEQGLPSIYAQGYGAYRVGDSSSNLSLFVQDEWRVLPRFTLRLGLRYQKEFFPALHHSVSNLGGTTLSYDVPDDDNNLAPRIALAFDPKGDRRTSLHAAYGIFFDDQRMGLRIFTRLADGSPNGYRQLFLSFPAASVAWRAPDHRLPEPTTPYASAVYAMAPGLRTPYAHHASIGLDHAIGKDMAVSASLVYVRGKHLLGTLDYNPLVASLGAGRRPNDVGGLPGTSASVFQLTDFAETWYRGLLVSVSRRFKGNSQLLVSYTLSKAEDITPDQIGLQGVRADDDGRGRNPDDPAGLPLGFDPLHEKGTAPGDQRHRLVVSGLCRLPWDFQFSGIFALASGRPFTAYAGVDLNGDGASRDRARRERTDPTTTVARNTETMPMQANVDARLSKRFTLPRGLAIEAIVEAFNLFDRTNYTEVNNIFGPGPFPDSPARDAQGRVTYGLFNKAQPPRQVQLAAKLSF